MRRSLLQIAVWVAVCARGAFAQVPAPVPPTGSARTDCTEQKSATAEIMGETHIKLVGAVEVVCPGDMKFYADDYIEIFSDVKRVVAVGNVVFTQGGTRISGDRAEFNYETKLGTFYNASGISSMGPKADRSMFGTLEPEVFFYGEKLEKIGDDRYRITRGAFTTCVQPEPRWKLVGSQTTIRLEHYAVLKNSVLKVKNVPVLYLPIMYYPIKKDDRATGFLIPVYGSSTLRGQSLSNAFFWAINRSQDATITHDWFTRTGQAIGGQYRYVRSAGAEGALTTQFLDEHESTFTRNGSEITTPARRSYRLNGGLSETIGRHVRARARVDYFSSLEVQQTYNQDILQASLSTRTYGGSASGTWGLYSVTGSMDRTEYLYASSDSSNVYGAWPRINAGRAERPIGDTPFYVTVNGEYANLIRDNRSGETLQQQGLGRFDMSPVLRVPFRKWSFFTVNSSAAFRYTHWNESRDDDGAQVPVPISRRFLDLQSNLTGPVFTKIFNTPGNGYAEKFKHTIEPYVNVRRTTLIDDFDRIVQLDATDTIVGGVTQFSYGLNNRFYAKRRAEAGRAREILNVSMRQTYYSKADASRYDTGYQSSYYQTRPQNFSPISIVVRTSPTDRIDGTFSTEYDTHFMSLRSLNASGGTSFGEWLRANVQWSQRFFVPGLPGYDDPNRHDQFLNQTTTLRSGANRVGGVYSFNYDLGQRTFLQQRIIGYYNAQCCGIALEYQAFDFTGLGSRSPIPKDTRFNFSFTLAGIGSFSNFFGALGGAPR